METLLGIGIIQSVLFLLLGLQKKNKQPHDWIMIVWLLLFGIHLSLILSLDYVNHSRFLLILTKAFTLLHGPLLFIYSQRVFARNHAPLEFVHFLPFLLIILLSYLLKSEYAMSFEYVLACMKIGSYVIYPLLSIRLLHKGIHALEMERSDDFPARLIWIKIIAILFLINISIGILHILISLTFDLEFSLGLDILIYVVSITLIGYYGLKLGVLYVAEKKLPAEQIAKSYRHSPLHESKRIETVKKVERFFQTQQDYLQPDFSLTALSEALGVPSHHLSEVINSDMDSTFYELVNGKRVLLVQKLIREGQYKHLTLEALGYEAGFNSKSAFFHHFKKFTGKTPKQYRQQISTD